MSVQAIAINVVPWVTLCSIGLRPKLRRDGLMPQRAAKVLGIFSTGKKLFSHRTFITLSHFNYFPFVWYFTTSKQLQNMEKSKKEH